MYSVFEELLNAKGVTAYKVSKATGISTATLSEWKNGKYTPKEDKLAKIAEYFGVSTEYLKTGKDTRFSDENAHLVALIRADERLNSALKKYMDLTEKDKNHVLELIDLLGKD